MFVCNGDTRYKCTTPKIKKLNKSDKILAFTIVDNISRADVLSLFATSAFYVFDETANVALFDADGREFKRIRITYNDDLSYEIKIKY